MSMISSRRRRLSSITLIFSIAPFSRGAFRARCRHRGHVRHREAEARRDAVDMHEGHQHAARRIR
jgi:hypothetical protein